MPKKKQRHSPHSSFILNRAKLDLLAFGQKAIMMERAVMMQEGAERGGDTKDAAPLRIAQSPSSSPVKAMKAAAKVMGTDTKDAAPLRMAQSPSSAAVKAMKAAAKVMKKATKWSLYGSAKVQCPRCGQQVAKGNFCKSKHFKTCPRFD
jgi:hypothetical protein